MQEQQKIEEEKKEDVIIDKDARVSIRKIAHRRDAHHSLDHYNSVTLDYLNNWTAGYVEYPAAIGTRMSVSGRDNWMSTSAIQSWCRIGSDVDKLLLPEGFPKDVDLSAEQLQDGDYLLATMNSIYVVRPFKCNCEGCDGCNKGAL